MVRCWTSSAHFWKAFRGKAPDARRRDLHRLRRCELRPGVATRLIGDDHRCNGCHSRSNEDPDRRRPARSRRSGAIGGRNPHLGPCPRWCDRPIGRERRSAPHDIGVRTGSGEEVSALLASIKPTLPVLLSNMTALGQVAVAYLPGLRQLMVLLPPAVAFYQSSRGVNNATGIPIGDFRIQISDPAACTVGFLPPAQWRSPRRPRRSTRPMTCTASPPGLPARRAWCSQHSLHGATRQTCTDSGDLRQRRAIWPHRDTAAHTGPVSVRPQPDIARHTTGRSGAGTGQNRTSSRRRKALHHPQVCLMMRRVPRLYRHHRSTLTTGWHQPIHRRTNTALQQPDPGRKYRLTLKRVPVPTSLRMPGGNPPPAAPRSQSPSTIRELVAIWPQTELAYQQSDLVHSPATWKDLGVPPGIPRQG